MPKMKWLTWASDFVLVASVLALALVVGLGVFFRYVLSAPLAFSFELSILIFAWTIFIGAVVAHSQSRHIQVDIAKGRVSPHVYAAFAITRELIVASVSGYVAWFGLELSLKAHGQISSLDLSNRYLYLAVPIGFGLIAVVALVRAVRLAMGKGETEANESHQ